MSEQKLKSLNELARHNPIVYAALTEWKSRDRYSLEDALISCVIALAEINKQQFDTIVKMTNERSAIIPPAGNAGV